MTTVENNGNQVSQSLLDSINGTSNKATATDEAQDRFMTLLVTQMKNQDPLNPLDNAQVTSQLAQLSTVTGIDKLNDSVEALAASMQSSQSLQISNLIGHEVLVAGSEFSFDGTGGYFGVELPNSTDDLTITINDSAGNQVRQLTFGNQEEGILPFSWDGYSDAGELMPVGEYSFTASANIGDTPTLTNTLTLAQITSISSGTGGFKLNLSNDESVTSEDLKQIF